MPVCSVLKIHFRNLGLDDPILSDNFSTAVETTTYKRDDVSRLFMTQLFVGF